MDQATLKHLLQYDPATGVFTWLSGKRSGKAAGFLQSHGYLQIQICDKAYYAHRLAWLFVHGELPDKVIDHVDGDRRNNAISNLRCVSQGENLQNQRTARSDNSCGALGVSAKAGKWRAAIRVAGRSIHLGTFASKEAASAAYIDAKRRLHPACAI